MTRFTSLLLGFSLLAAPTLAMAQGTQGAAKEPAKPVASITAPAATAPALTAKAPASQKVVESAPKAKAAAVANVQKAAPEQAKPHG